MDLIEKKRKLFKSIQYAGMFIILGGGMGSIYLIKSRDTNLMLTISMFTIMLMFVFLSFVIVPMQNKLLRLVIKESLVGLCDNIKFDSKKGYAKEAFEKLAILEKIPTNYGNIDYYSFNYKDKFIESVTIKAYDELKLKKSTNAKGKKIKAHKEEKIYFYGRLYIIPFVSNNSLNIYTKKYPSLSFKNLMKDKEYNSMLDLKTKKQSETFEVYYKDNKPEYDIQSFLDKLYNLKLQSKGEVFAFFRDKTLVLAINNGHYYKEIDFKNSIDNNLIRDYRKEVSMVTSFINSIEK